MAILNSYQIHFLTKFQQDNEVNNHFYLAGGTALSAYYLQHRLSDDLDFFTTEEVNFSTIAQRLQHNQETLHIKQRTHKKTHYRNLVQITYQDNFELKCEFTKYYDPLYPYQVFNGQNVEHLQDIIIDKIACIIDRNDPKDFVDIYYYFKDQEIIEREELLKQYADKFGNTISLAVFAYSLFKGSKIQLLPHIIDKELKIEIIHNFFRRQAHNCGISSQIFES